MKQHLDLIMKCLRDTDDEYQIIWPRYGKVTMEFDIQDSMTLIGRIGVYHTKKIEVKKTA